MTIPTLIATLVIEAFIFFLSLLITIPQIKKELQILNEQFKVANETQSALVNTVIRMEERLENHIHDTHIHKQ